MCPQRRRRSDVGRDDWLGASELYQDVVPALSRDPRASAVALVATQRPLNPGAVAIGFSSNRHRWLWVSAQGRDDEVWGSAGLLADRLRCGFDRSAALPAPDGPGCQPDGQCHAENRRDPDMRVDPGIRGE